jgi:exopolysaccharide biosynthesis WecB/TagA/CpsF family protein
VVGIGLCVGASMDFLSGSRKRAPQWMQQARLEWLFRLLDEPQKLWRRYLVEGPKIFRIWLAWRKAR